MRRAGAAWIGALAALALLAPLAPRSEAASTLIKLATLVPDGSVWDKVLKQMGSDWKARTGGRVSLRIYPSGVAGDEPDVVRKMRIGQLHAGALTVTGLSEIEPYFKIFGVPMFFDSYEELYYVLERLEPLLAERLEAKGFVFVNWGNGGWVHLFSTSPIRQVDDLRRLKLFQWAGDDEMVQWWKKEGFQPVALAATDIMTGLQTGMIEALPTTPLAGLSLQWFRQTPYMHELGLAPLVGATVVTRRAWDRISEHDRTALLAAAEEAERRLEEEIPEQDRKAVEEMQKRGLEVVTGEDAEEWRREAQRFAASMRDSRVPAEIFDRAVAERDAYRKSRTAEGSN